MSKPSDVVQGTLDLLLLKILALEPMHGWAISQRLGQVFQLVVARGFQSDVQVGHCHDGLRAVAGASSVLPGTGAKTSGCPRYVAATVFRPEHGDRQSLFR